MRVIYFLFSILLSLNIYAAITDLDKALIGVENVSPNGGVESGKNGFSANGGTSAIAIETTNKLSGKAAIKFTSSEATDYLATSAYAVKHGPNAMMSFYYKSTSAAFVAEVMEGSNVVATLALPANTAFQLAELSFVATNATTTYHLHVRGGAAADIIYVDDLYQGKNLNIGSVNLADKQYDISSYVTGFNTIDRAVAVVRKTRTGAYRLEGNIGGSFSSPASSFNIGITGVIFNSAKRQSILVSDSGGNVYSTWAVAGAGENLFRINMSTTISNPILSFDVELDSKPTWATDYAAEQVVRAEVANQYGASRWKTATNSNTVTDGTLTNMNISGGDSARTNYGAAVNQATAGDIAIKIPSLAPGTYEVDINATMVTTNANAQNGCEFYITDGTTTRMINTVFSEYASNTRGSASYGKAIFSYSTIGDRTFTLQAAHTWQSGGCAVISNYFIGLNDTMMTVKPVMPQVAMPQIVNSVGTAYQGQTSLNSLSVGGASVTTACTTSPCTVYNSTGSWYTSVTRNQTGDYTVNFAPGVFSARPNCVCSTYAQLGAIKCLPRTVTSTYMQYQTVDDPGGARTDDISSVICHGIK